MDIEIARHLIRTAFRSSGELSALLPLLKEHCGTEEYKNYAQGVAAAIHGINIALIDKATASFPELESEMESYIAKYGRYL